MQSNKSVKSFISPRYFILSVIASLALNACSLFIDDPVTHALQHTETITTMPEGQFQELRKGLALREQGSFDFLRARIAQGTRLSFAVDSMHRPKAKQRDVIVSVSARSGARDGQELARIRVRLEQNEKGVWKVVAFQLVE